MTHNYVIRDPNYAAIRLSFWNLGYHTSCREYILLYNYAKQSLYIYLLFHENVDLRRQASKTHDTQSQRSRFITLLVQSSRKCFRLYVWEEQLCVLIPVFYFFYFCFPSPVNSWRTSVSVMNVNRSCLVRLHERW